MADAKGEETLGGQLVSQQLSKRKPVVESAADEAAVIQSKKPKAPDGSPDLPPTGEADDGAQADTRKGEDEEEKSKDDGASSNGKAAVDKGKGVVTAADKGKAKMVVEEDEEDEDEDGNGDSDSSDDDDDSDDDVVVGEGDFESDFSDDPLAEVDLSNILPSRTRRRGPPLPGAYLVNDLDEDDDDDDDDVCD